MMNIKMYEGGFTLINIYVKIIYEYININP